MATRDGTDNVRFDVNRHGIASRRKDRERRGLPGFAQVELKYSVACAVRGLFAADAQLASARRGVSSASRVGQGSTVQAS